MMNVVAVVGRLVRDPEVRYTPNGVAVGGFTVAVQRPFANEQGEREADFIDVVVWRKLAENCANHLRKGRLVAVRGRLQTRTWTDKQGGRRKAVEVVADEVDFLDRGEREGDGDEPAGDMAADVPF